MIFIFLMGGASQFETFDPKPGQDTGGPYAAIDTRLPGVQFCEHMPRLAAMNDKFSVIRTLQGGGHGSGAAADDGVVGVTVGALARGGEAHEP